MGRPACLKAPAIEADDNDGIRLAVSPICGSFSGIATDVNAGLDLKRYKTIVSFGVSSHTFIYSSPHPCTRPDFCRIPIQAEESKMALHSTQRFYIRLIRGQEDGPQTANSGSSISQTRSVPV